MGAGPQRPSRFSSSPRAPKRTLIRDASPTKVQSEMAPEHNHAMQPNVREFDGNQINSTLGRVYSIPHRVGADKE